MSHNDRELCRTAGPSKMRRPTSAFRVCLLSTRQDSPTELPTFASVLGRLAGN
jgi:hypothetical protein